MPPPHRLAVGPDEVGLRQPPQLTQSRPELAFDRQPPLRQFHIAPLGQRISARYSLYFRSANHSPVFFGARPSFPL